MLSSTALTVAGGRLDTLDWQLIHALQLDGRAPFRRIGEVLDTSEQTVARRYRRLRDDYGMRIVGLTDATAAGLERWHVRVRCAPDAVDTMTEALARRDDTAWIHVLSGGTEICFPATSELGGTSPLLERLPQTPKVHAVEAHSVLHMFMGGPRAWPERTNALTDDQVAALTRDVPPAATPAEPVPLSGDDRRLLAALEQDGRAKAVDLARVVGVAESTVRRRIEQLRGLGVLYVDMDLDNRPLGFTAPTMLYLAVDPAHLVEAGEALSGHPQICFAAATTGRTNLAAIAICRNAAKLYEYLTTAIARLPGVQRVESAPISRSAKMAGPARPERRPGRKRTPIRRSSPAG